MILPRLRDQQWVTNFLIRAGALAGMIVTIMVTFLIYVVITASRPPLAFTQDEYQVSPSTFCPGDVLSYTAQVIVHRSPVAPTVVRTWWNVATNSQISEQTSANPEIQIWIGKPVYVVSFPISDTIPDFPPGSYEQRGAIRINLLYAAAYRVRFVIPDSCAGSGKTVK